MEGLLFFGEEAEEIIVVVAECRSDEYKTTATFGAEQHGLLKQCRLSRRSTIVISSIKM
jgi:hypothetical protein